MARRRAAGRRRDAVALAAALAAALATSGCAGEPEPVPTTTVTPAPEPVRATPPPVEAWTPPDVDLAALPVADPWAVMPQAVPDPDPDAMPSGLLVTPAADPGIALYDAPRGTPFAMLPLVQYRGVTSYPVVAQEGDWYQVLLTVRRGLPSAVGPDGVNEATGWVHADDVVESRTEYRITASLSTGEVVLHRGDEEVARTETGFGTPRTPTPVGRTFVMSIAPDPGATYSPVFVYFGAHSPTLDEFSGGPAPIAIHAYASHSGPISNGCLRVPAEALAPFAEVPLGTPVLVTA